MKMRAPISSARGASPELIVPFLGAWDGQHTLAILEFPPGLDMDIYLFSLLPLSTWIRRTPIF